MSLDTSIMNLAPTALLGDLTLSANYFRSDHWRERQLPDWVRTAETRHRTDGLFDTRPPSLTEYHVGPQPTVHRCRPDCARCQHRHPQ